MPNRTCERCDTPLLKKPGPGRWPKFCPECRTAREARPSRHKPAPKTTRTCPVCEETFEANGTRRYCTRVCLEKAKYQRLRNDPEKWAKQLESLRARYVPRPPRPSRKPCAIDDCGYLSWAKGLCGPHYAKRRRALGLDGPKNPITVIGSTASLYGAYFPKPKRIKVRVTVGVMAFCPWCDALMAASSPIDRTCRKCGTTVTLNAEEVSWVISEKRLTAA